MVLSAQHSNHPSGKRGGACSPAFQDAILEPVAAGLMPAFPYACFPLLIGHDGWMDGQWVILRSKMGIDPLTQAPCRPKLP